MSTDDDTKATFAKEDAQTKATLHEIADELALNEDEPTKRARLAREVLEEYSRGVNADPDKIRFLIEQELVDNAAQYPSLLDIHNGRVEDIAPKCRDHMLICESQGIAITHKQALGWLEGVAAQFKYRTGLGSISTGIWNPQTGHGHKK